ncbi:nucleolin 1 isoform X3 [Rosa chinensis]|uniref:nucleolin 1 isoform X3 n=1 Tax=Rosa chinensis TaxID=74649 RepID=UPI000D0966BA|nr:nucleolin 1 isoform X3 [Rosa chinensis]
MGKSSKKSATKVEAAPAAAVPVSKSGKKGKREAENEIEKAVSAKKQKRDEGVVQAIQKKKAEAKLPQKKKKEESSSEEESDTSSSEDEKPAPKTKTVVPPKKQAIVAKSGTAKKEESSSSESESDSDEDEKPATKTGDAAKNGTVAKKAESSDSSDSSEDDSDEDDVPKSKATNLPQVVAKNGKKKEDSSSLDTDSSDDSEDDDETPAKVTAPVKKVVAPAAKKPDSSSSEGDSDDEPKNAKPAAKRAQPSKSESESESESDSDEEPQTKKPKAEVPAKAAPKESSSEEESDEDSSDEESEEEAKTPKKKDSDVEMVDAQSKSEKKAPKTPATPETSSSKTLFAGNLSFKIEQRDVEEFFKDVAEVVEVRFSSDQEGQFRGYGHVEFASAEDAQKALELNGSDLLGRAVRLDLARERGERGAYTPHSGKESNSYQKGGQGQSQTIFVRGFDTNQGEDEIRGALQSHFGSCGEITRVSIPKDYETGASKGMAYMDFSSADAFSKALELDQSDLGNGCYLNVQPAKPKGDFGERTSGNRFDNGGRRGGRRGGRYESGGRRGGGRLDSGGRRGGRDSGGRRGGRGPSLATPGTGKKTTFNDED